MSDNKSIHKFKAGDVFHDRYTLEKLIGVDYFSDVWKAIDNQACVNVVLKVFTNLDEEVISVSSVDYFEMQQQFDRIDFIKTVQYDRCENIPYIVVMLCDNCSYDRAIGYILAHNFSSRRNPQSALCKEVENNVIKNAKEQSIFFQNKNIYILFIAFFIFISIGVVCFFHNDKTNEILSNQEIEKGKTGSEGSNEIFVIEPENTESRNINIGIESNQSESNSRSSKLDQRREQEPQKNNSQKTVDMQYVSDDYLNLLHSTYNSIGTLNKYISNAQNRRHFTSAEANFLR